MRGTLSLKNIFLTSTCSGTCTKTLCLQKRRSKFALLLRSFIFFSVIIVFYTKFLIQTHSADREFVKSTNNAKYGRHILSLANDYYDDNDVNSSTTVAPTPTPTPTPRKNCSSPTINEFPSDGLTREQRQNGWISLHILLSFYSFWLLAAICDDYFVPSIEQLCATLGMQKDVVGATIMAAANSSSELFMNVVGTFVTKGDIGVSTIVGSAVFNVLAVPACCGLVVGQLVHLDWWPVTRDCLIYCVAVCALIGTLIDGVIMWYEALSLLIGYVLYMTVLYYNDKMAVTARKLISKYRRRKRARPFREVSELTPMLLTGSISSVNIKSNNNLESESLESVEYKEKGQLHSVAIKPASLESICASDSSDAIDSPWQRQDRDFVEFLLRWPITLALWLTIPDSRRYPKYRYITFLLSVAWIGAISYLIAYMITIIGDTLNIPDAVMGLTILAAGMSVPEAVSSIIVTKQGQGAMGISNSLGSNTFDIFLCLGLPWFIKAYFLPETEGQHWVILNSTGITYSAIILLTTLFCLYIAFVANRFVLNWKIGIACSIMYVGFMSIASMIELNLFFDVSLPVCRR